MFVPTFAPVTYWLELSHHAPFRVGGWAFVRREGEAVAGQAAGERRIDPERAALKALVSVLTELPAGTAPVVIHTGARAIVEIPARIRAAEAGGEAPADNLDLWAQAIRVLAQPRVEIRPAQGGARPSAFAAAWAELARDRAKDQGNFSAAIPKPNLAKAGAL